MCMFFVNFSFVVLVVVFFPRSNVVSSKDRVTKIVKQYNVV